MEPKMLLSILHQAEKLKCTTRHADTSTGRRESVADHSWRLSLMAMLVSDAFPRLDMDRVIRMCLIHDLGEAFTGDIPAFRKTAEDEREEERRLHDWIETLPQPYAGEMLALYGEMAALQTTEAKIYKAIDNMEAVIQHNESPLESWLPEEYPLNLTYGTDKAAFSAYLTALRAAVREVTERKIAEGK